MRKIPPELWPKCCICGKPKSGQIDGKFYCNKHWQSMYHYGQPYGHIYKSKNHFEIKGNVLYITTRKGEVILADATDYEKLSSHSWCISRTGYPVSNINGKTTKLHRYLLNLNDPKVVVDHKNHDTLDNRRSNIRICTQRENARNKGGKDVHGVRKTPCGNYAVQIMFNRKHIYIGTYKTYDEAVQARYEAEDKYHGEFAYHRSKEMTK